jgi:hypothetical protein
MKRLHAPSACQHTADDGAPDASPSSLITRDLECYVAEAPSADRAHEAEGDLDRRRLGLAAVPTAASLLATYSRSRSPIRLVAHHRHHHVLPPVYCGRAGCSPWRGRLGFAKPDIAAGRRISVGTLGFW